MYDERSPNRNGQLKKPSLVIHIWTLVALWTLGVSTSLCFNIFHTYNHTEKSALIQARTAFEKDVVYRRWNSGLGGLYVKVTPKVLPNPHLQANHDRDIPGPNNTPLTLVNPAYMTRLVHELGELASGVRGHITSICPIRPENAPDPWEQKALARLEQSSSDELFEIQAIEGKYYLRLMGVLRTERSCLACHGAQGYTIGQIRGGISVSVPMEPVMAGARTTVAILGVSHGILWLAGALVIILGGKRLVRYMHERDEAVRQLQSCTGIPSEPEQVEGRDDADGE